MRIFLAEVDWIILRFSRSRGMYSTRTEVHLMAAVQIQTREKKKKKRKLRQSHFVPPFLFPLSRSPAAPESGTTRLGISMRLKEWGARGGPCGHEETRKLLNAELVPKARQAAKHVPVYCIIVVPARAYSGVLYLTQADSCRSRGTFTAFSRDGGDLQGEFSGPKTNALTPVVLGWFPWADMTAAVCCRLLLLLLLVCS